MHPGLFRLLEKHQRIDELLRRAERCSDAFGIRRLRSLKLKARHSIHRFSPTPVLS